MTKLLNHPAEFADEAIEGFVAAHGDDVRAVHGGVVRATVSPAGQVAVVLGGGSGHYPAFAGWVGPGFAHGAACGNVFASPSASQIYAVAKAADNGGGIVFGFGNYAGDVLHFGQATARLRAEGCDVRIVSTTDDVASAPIDEIGNRRGIAGDLPVFKIMSAAAEAGLTLDDVEAVGQRANNATRSFGVAFDGCTLPGAAKPLFTVADGQMAIGLGIHGEPGIDEQPQPTADQLAAMLVDGVLAEEPARAPDGYQGRVAVLLNGLGTVKYEELFVVYRKVSELLLAAGMTIVAPEIGEHVTSLDMSGVSLTLTFLDATLEPFWLAPTNTPAFRRGNVEPRERRAVDGSGPGNQKTPVGSLASQIAAAAAARALVQARGIVVQNEARLGDIDAVAGDGDHGIGMARGTAAAASAGERARADGAGIGTLLRSAGDAWSERGGGTSGALWGAALAAMGSALGDEQEIGDADVVRAVRAGVDAFTDLGGASVGDKTMVDSAVPFAETLEQCFAAKNDLTAAAASAVAAATHAAERTADISARRGRARTHGDRSLGTPDAGAVSFALLVAGITDGLSASATSKENN